MLRLVAEYGVLDTGQVAAALGMSRPTAHRRLIELSASGLLIRSREDSRSHRNRYRLAPDGLATIAFWNSSDPHASLPHLAARASALSGGRGNQDVVNAFFLAIAEHGRRAGTGVLSRWLHRVDADRWLDDQGLPQARCDGYGVYLTLDERDAGTAASVAFTLHWATARAVDNDPRGNPELDPAVVLGDYDRPIRLDAALVVAESLTAEAAFLSHALTHAVPVRVATTCEDLLRTDREGPIGPIWATASSIAGTGSRRARLSALGTS